MTEVTELNFTYVHETKNALLIDVGNDREIWVPKSTLRDFPNFKHIKGDRLTLHIAAWFALKQGLI